MQSYDDIISLPKRARVTNVKRNTSRDTYYVTTRILLSLAEHTMHCEQEMPMACGESLGFWHETMEAETLGLPSMKLLLSRLVCINKKSWELGFQKILETPLSRLKCLIRKCLFEFDWYNHHFSNNRPGWVGGY